MTTSGWYSDPEGRNDLRYWDGRRWTDNVSNFGIPDVEPPTSDHLPPPGTGPARPCLDVMVQVQKAWGPKAQPLRIDDDGVHYEGITTPIAAIEDYATQAINVNLRETHLLVLITDQGPRSLRWMGYLGNYGPARQAMQMATAVLFDLVGRVRVEDVLRRVEAGELATLGRWRLARTGAQTGREPVSFRWDESVSFVERQDHGWDVTVVRDGRSRKVAGISSSEPAGPLLLATLSALRERYGR